MLGLALRRAQHDRLYDCLEGYISDSHRVLIVRTLLVIFLIVGRFLAWQEQYELALKRSAAPPPSAKVFRRRRLMPEQVESLAISLERIKLIHSVIIAASNTDPEAWDYAVDFERAAKRAGWTVVGAGITNRSDEGGGITVYFGAASDWQSVYGDAIDAACARAQIKIMGRGVMPSLHPGQIEIFVGFNSGP